MLKSLSWKLLLILLVVFLDLFCSVVRGSVARDDVDGHERMDSDEIEGFLSIDWSSVVLGFLVMLREELSIALLLFRSDVGLLTMEGADDDAEEVEVSFGTGLSCES